MTNVPSFSDYLGDASFFAQVQAHRRKFREIAGSRLEILSYMREYMYAIETTACRRDIVTDFRPDDAINIAALALLLYEKSDKPKPST